MNWIELAVIFVAYDVTHECLLINWFKSPIGIDVWRQKYCVWLPISSSLSRVKNEQLHFRIIWAKAIQRNKYSIKILSYSPGARKYPHYMFSFSMLIQIKAPEIILSFLSHCTPLSPISPFIWANLSSSWTNIKNYYT